MRNKTFYKYLLSYAVVLLLPIIIFSIGIYTVFIQYYTDAIMQENHDSLQRAKTSFDMQFNQLYANAVYCAKNPVFNTRKLRDNLSAFYDVQDSLSIVKLTNSLIHDIYYYNNDLNLIYSVNAVYPAELFQSQMPNDRETSFQLLNQVEQMPYSGLWFGQQKVFTNGTWKDLIIYIVPLNYARTKVSSMLIYQIDSATIDHIIGRSFHDNGSQLIITHSNQIIYSTDQDMSEINPQMLQPAEGNGIGSYTSTTIKDEKVFMSYTTSDNAYLTYIYIIPASILLDRVKHLQNIFYIGISLILFTGTLIIIIIMRYNYLPIHKLSKMIDSLFPESKRNTDIVNNTCDTLLQLSERIKSSDIESRELRREKILMKLLNGSITSVGCFNQAGEEVDLHFDAGSVFCVIVCEYHSADSLHSNANRSNLMSLIENFMNPICKTYLLEFSENNHLVMIVACLEKSLNKIKDILLAISDTLIDKQGIECSFYVGSRYAETTDINKSYFEAMSLMQTKTAKNDCLILLYNERTVDSKMSIFPANAFASFYEAIVNCNIDKINLIIKVILEHIIQAQDPAIISYICYDLIQTTENAVNELSNVDYNLKRKYANQLFDCNGDKNHSVLLINNLLIDVVSIIEAMNVKPSYGNLANIISYIQSNYMKDDFSVKAVASLFDMSLSNFSHYFKNNTGQNVSDYISTLRHEKAKDLLVRTDLPIHAISAQVGYLQTSSLMRKFKSIEGMTPGEYRSIISTNCNIPVQQ